LSSFEEEVGFDAEKGAVFISAEEVDTESPCMGGQYDCLLAAADIVPVDASRR
jgi:hypothetical protein